VGDASQGSGPSHAATALSPMGQRFFGTTHVQTPLLLGPSNRQVFAVYHPPAESAGRALTVICPPLFNEYMRTQLALRELAISLAEKGHHVIRFDYRGTGDSSGDLDEVIVSDWLADIGLTMRKGLELSGCDKVRLLAVRAAALLASKVARAFDEDVERVVLWDPVPDGARYLQGLRRLQTSLIERDISRADAALSNSLREYAGYRLSEGMVDQFRALQASTYTDVDSSKLHVVTSSHDGFDTLPIRHEVAPFACDWESELENMMMPKPVLERLEICLTTS